MHIAGRSVYLSRDSRQTIAKPRSNAETAIVYLSRDSRQTIAAPTAPYCVTEVYLSRDSRQTIARFGGDQRGDKVYLSRDSRQTIAEYDPFIQKALVYLSRDSRQTIAPRHPGPHHPDSVSQPRFPANHSTSEAIPAGLRERTTASDLILAQAQFEPEPQHFLDLPHGQFFRRQCRFLLFPEEPRLPDSRAFSPTFLIVPPQLTQVMVVLLRGGVETRKLRAEPNDRFLSVPPVAHPLAVTHALLGGYGRAFAIPCCVGVSIGRPCSSPSITCGNPPAATRWATRCLFSGID